MLSRTLLRTASRTAALADLKFEVVTDVAPLLEASMTVFIEDAMEKKVDASVPEPISLNKVAKTKDGQVVGGLIGVSEWNYLELSHVAVHPDFRGRGIGTALMKCAEEAARGPLNCCQMHASVLSWQPQRFFAKLGYAPQWTVQNHPRGHATHHLAKEWAFGFRDEPAVGYGGAAADVTLEDWDVEAATAQLETWLCADAEQHGAPNVFPRKVTHHALKALHPDGSLAAVCIYIQYWNIIYVHMLTVVKSVKGRGVGSAVLRKMDEIARERGCDHITLYTMNWQARPFYEKNGYKCVATQKNLPLAFERHVMHRELRAAPQSKL